MATDPVHDENDLLEYQTEADEPDPEAAAAVPVVVDEPVVTIPTVPQHMTAYTLVVEADDAAGGVAELLPQDPLRVRAQIIVNDEPVILCHSRTQALDSRNTVASVPNPSGAYIPDGIGFPIEITATDRMWIAATSTNPARVSVITERRSS